MTTTTDDVKKRIETAQWMLERQLGWISAADGKIGFVIALQAGMIAGLATAFSTATARSSLTIFFIFCYIALAVYVIGCACKATSPRVAGPDSLLYCGSITKTDSFRYKEKCREATDIAILEDWLEQVYRNAEIACAKFAWVKRAIDWSIISGGPWGISIVLLVIA